MITKFFILIVLFIVILSIITLNKDINEGFDNSTDHDEMYHVENKPKNSKYAKGSKVIYDKNIVMIESIPSNERQLYGISYGDNRDNIHVYEEDLLPLSSYTEESKILLPNPDPSVCSLGSAPDDWLNEIGDDYYDGNIDKQPTDCATGKLSNEDIKNNCSNKEFREICPATCYACGHKDKKYYTRKNKKTYSDNKIILPIPTTCKGNVEDKFLREFESNPRVDNEVDCNGGIKVGDNVIDTCDNETFRNKCPASCYACATGKKGQELTLNKDENYLKKQKEQLIKESRKIFKENKDKLIDGYDINSTSDPEISYNIFDKLNYKRALINSYLIKKKEESFLNELLQRFN